MKNTILGGALLALLVTTGCAFAPGYYSVPRQEQITTYAAFTADQRAILATVGGDCLVQVVFRNGRTVRAKVEDAICREASTWVSAEQAGRASVQSAAPVAKPTPPTQEETK